MSAEWRDTGNKGWFILFKIDLPEPDYLYVGKLTSNKPWEATWYMADWVEFDKNLTDEEAKAMALMAYRMR